MAAERESGKVREACWDKLRQKDEEAWVEQSLAERERHAAELAQARAAALEEAARLVDIGHPFFMQRRQVLVDAIRQLAAAEKPDDIPCRCGTGWTCAKHIVSKPVASFSFREFL